jgi:aminopeptidase
VSAVAEAVGGIATPQELERYADAVVLGSLYLRPEDTLFVQAEPSHREIAVGLAEAAYKSGAALVDVQYADRRLTAARVRHAADEHLGPVSDWHRRKLREQLKPTSCVVTILGEDDPGVFDGLPAERVAQDGFASLQRVSWYVRAVMRGARRWVGMGWPTAFWASQVFPDLEPREAQRRLLEELLWFCRLGPDDPPGYEGWTRHVDTLAARAHELTALELERVELRGPGTDLTVRLAPGTLWLGGQEENEQGFLLAGNIPTEENFTSPDPPGTEGTFRCSRPLDFRGRTIEGISGEFRRGRLVRLEASDDDDREFLAAHIDADRNADRLGEVALVDATSRIGQTGRVYSNTLFDENAVAHIAFGAGFGQTRKQGARRPNKANLHLDVMIGTADFEATGYAGGKSIPLIREGLWQI